MTDQEFRTEMRRGLITIMRACIGYLGMAWSDFLPRDEGYTVTTPYQTMTPTWPTSITSVPYVPPSTTDK